MSEPFERHLPVGSGANSTDVFIYISKAIEVEWVAHRTVAEAGMVPIFYKGLQLADRNSNVGNEAQTDLWECDALVVAITCKEAQEPARLWIYDQLEVAARRGIPIFIYVWGSPADARLLRRFGDTPGVALKNVTDHNEFAAVLREDLKAVRRA
ncbi:MAG TPA: hypothetical protein VIW07_13245 [Candidatus Udaeobacter sp.]